MSARLPRECERVREQLPEYADGSLLGAAKQTVERHVETCERCAAEVADLRVVISAARAVPQEDPPERLVARVAGAMRGQAPVAPRQFWVRLAIPAAVLTGVVAVSFALRSPYRQGRAPPLAPREHAAVSEPLAAEGEPEFARGVEAIRPRSVQSTERRARSESRAAVTDEAQELGQPAFRPDVRKEARAQDGGVAGRGRSRGGRGGGGVGYERVLEAPSPPGGTPSRSARVGEARGEDLTETYGGRDRRIADAGPAAEAKPVPAPPPQSPPRPQEEEDQLAARAEPLAAMPSPQPPVSTTVTVVRTATGENLLALQLSGEQPIRELSLQVGDATPTTHQWLGDADRPALIPLPGERIGTGPAAVPVAVMTQEGRGEYVLFVPTLSRLGESAPQAPAGRWQSVDVRQALLDLSTFTGLVILAERPLTAELTGDIPAGTPVQALQQLAAEAGFHVHQEGAIAYTLTHMR